MCDYSIDPLVKQVTPALFVDRTCVVCGADAEVIREWDDVAYCADDAELLRVFLDPGGVIVAQSLYERWGFRAPGVKV